MSLPVTQQFEFLVDLYLSAVKGVEIMAVGLVDDLGVLKGGVKHIDPALEQISDELVGALVLMGHSYLITIHHLTVKQHTNKQ